MRADLFFFSRCCCCCRCLPVWVCATRFIVSLTFKTNSQQKHEWVAHTHTQATITKKLYYCIYVKRQLCNYIYYCCSEFYLSLYRRMCVYMCVCLFLPTLISDQAYSGILSIRIQSNSVPICQNSFVCFIIRIRNALDVRIVQKETDWGTTWNEGRPPNAQKQCDNNDYIHDNEWTNIRHIFHMNILFFSMSSLLCATRTRMNEF